MVTVVVGEEEEEEGMTTGGVGPAGATMTEEGVEIGTGETTGGVEEAEEGALVGARVALGAGAGEPGNNVSGVLYSS